ncbi:MAG: NAD-dependent epimerase/dehydratase family protein, partial [Pirellulales bacterium]
VDIKIVRIFNTYGPHMHPFDGRVVSNFIRQAVAGEDITVFGVVDIEDDHDHPAAGGLYDLEGTGDVDDFAFADDEAGIDAVQAALPEKDEVDNKAPSRSSQINTCALMVIATVIRPDEMKNLSDEDKMIHLMKKFGEIGPDEIQLLFKMAARNIGADKNDKTKFLLTMMSVDGTISDYTSGMASSEHGPERSQFQFMYNRGKLVLIGGTIGKVNGGSRITFDVFGKWEKE